MITTTLTLNGLDLSFPESYANQNLTCSPEIVSGRQANMLSGGFEELEVVRKKTWRLTVFLGDLYDDLMAMLGSTVVFVDCFETSYNVKIQGAPTFHPYPYEGKAMVSLMLREV